MKKSKLLVIIILLVLSIANIVVVDALSNNNSTWDIHYDNLRVLEGSTNGTAKISKDKNNINYDVYLDRPGDFYEFSVDVKNDGSYDAVVDTFTKSNTKSYLDYSIKYSDGRTIKKGDVLKRHDSKKLIIRIEYKKDITSKELPQEDETISLPISINYRQDV